MWPCTSILTTRGWTIRRTGADTARSRAERSRFAKNTGTINFRPAALALSMAATPAAVLAVVRAAKPTFRCASGSDVCTYWREGVH